MFGKRARISLSLDVGNEVCFAVDAALSEAGSLGRYSERAWASAVCWIMECNNGEAFLAFPKMNASAAFTQRQAVVRAALECWLGRVLGRGLELAKVLESAMEARDSAIRAMAR